MSRGNGGGWLVVALGALGFGVLVEAACGSEEECADQTCELFGGAPNRRMSTCFTSGSGSTKDQFVVKDDTGKQLVSCVRSANDNVGCGAELIAAKTAFCKNVASPSPTSASSTSSASSSGSASSASSSGTSGGASTSGTSGTTSSGSTGTSSGGGSSGTSSGGSSGTSSGGSSGTSSGGSSGTSSGGSSGTSSGGNQ